MRFTDYFWDFDGTLFDTYPNITGAFQRGAKALGIDISLERTLKLVKVSIPYATQIVAAENGLDPEALAEQYRFYRKLEDPQTLRPYDGTVSLVRAIVREGGRNYLYTHSGQMAMDTLRCWDVADCFADAITADDKFPLKPAPDALLHLMKKHGLDPACCVMLGDRDIDVEAGLNAGMAGALFDPDGFFDEMPIAYRFKTMREIEQAFVEEKGK